MNQRDARSERSLSALFQQGYCWAYQYLRKRGLSVEDSEDGAQEVALQLWCRCRRQNLISGLSDRPLWRRIAHCQLVNDWRTISARRSARILHSASCSPPPDEVLLAREALRLLVRTPGYTEVEAHALGTSDADLAETAHQSPAAVRQRRVRFRALHVDLRHQHTAPSWLAEGCSRTSPAFPEEV